MRVEKNFIRIEVDVHFFFDVFGRGGRGESGGRVFGIEQDCFQFERQLNQYEKRETVGVLGETVEDAESARIPHLSILQIAEQTDCDRLKVVEHIRARLVSMRQLRQHIEYAAFGAIYCLNALLIGENEHWRCWLLRLRFFYFFFFFRLVLVWFILFFV